MPRKSRTKIFFIIVVVIFLISLLSAIVFNNNRLHTSYEIWSLENQYKDINIGNLNIDGKTYSVENGKIVGNVDSSTKLKVLSLLAFYQWNREDPLFYSPDLDGQNLKTVVDKINADQKILLGIIKTGKNLYPADFLESFSSSSDSMRNFLQNPSFITAKLLIETQKQAAYLYRRESLSLVSFIKEKNPDSKFGIVDFNVKRSIGEISSDLSKISSNSDILLSEITKRENCLKGIGACQRPALSFNKPTQTKITEPQLTEPLLDKKLIFSPLSTTFDYSKVKGPYVAKTPCFGWGDNFTYPDHFFYLEENPTQTNIQLATDLYFRKLTKPAILPWEEAVIVEGIEYTPVTSSTLYACPYNENLAEISEMHLFLEHNKPILSSINLSNTSNKEIFNTAKNIEEEFFNSKYPSYENAQILSNYYGYLYKLIIQDKTLLNNNSSIKDELLRRKLVLSLKLGDFDKILNYAEYLINGTKKLMSVEQASGSWFAETILYPFRNFYGVMYMPFSQAVFRNGRLSYYDKVKVKNAVVVAGSLVSYTEAVGKYAKSEIFKWLGATFY